MTIDRTSDQFLLDAYTGKGGFASGEYLVSHPRESADKFSRRKELAVYPNYCRKIVDVFMGFLWKQAPARETDELYSQFAEDADGTGSKLNSLLFTYQRLAMITGTVFVIVDKPATQGQTRAEQAMPYLALRMKDQLVAEKKDQAGNWLSVTFSEAVDNQTRCRTFTETAWIVSEDAKATKIIEQGEHNLGRVPVVRLHISKPLNPMATTADSFFYDLAGLCWKLYNLDSEKRELFRAQTFAILALPVADDAEREKLKDLTIGTENALTYNPTGGGKPEFIAPPPDPIQLYQAEIESVVTEIYRVANLEFVGGVQQSGVALAFHFQEANSTLVGMAEMCEMAEKEIARLVYLWQGLEFSGNIAYASDFNITDLQQAINTAMDAVNLQMGAEFDKAIKKRLAKQILGNDTLPATMQAIDNEIDAQGDTYGDRIAQQAGMA